MAIIVQCNLPVLLLLEASSSELNKDPNGNAAANPAPAERAAAGMAEPDHDAQAWEAEGDDEDEDENEDLDGESCSFPGDDRAEFGDAREDAGHGGHMEETQVVDDSNEEDDLEPSKDLASAIRPECSARPIATPQHASLPLPPLAGASSYESLGSLPSLCGMMNAMALTAPSRGTSLEDSIENKVAAFLFGLIGVHFLSNAQLPPKLQDSHTDVVDVDSGDEVSMVAPNLELMMTSAQQHLTRLNAALSLKTATFHCNSTCS